MRCLITVELRGVRKISGRLFFSPRDAGIIEDNNGKFHNIGFQVPRKTKTRTRNLYKMEESSNKREGSYYKARSMDLDTT